MSVSKYATVWILLSQGKFKICPNNSDDNLKCVICSKLMVDCVVSSMCGCQYCYTCINGYINDTEVHCPGNKEECKDDIISFNKNIFRSAILNKKISKLKVNCPNQTCTFSSDLMDMDDHLRQCTKQPIECPFVPIGCKGEKAMKDKVVDHLNRDMFDHSGLLIESIQALSKELRDLKQNIELLNERLKEKDSTMEKMGEELRKIKNEMERKILKNTVKKQKKILRQKEESENLSTEKQKIMKIVNDLRSNINEMKELKDKYDLITERETGKWNKMYFDNNATFVWTINDFTKKLFTQIFSDSFYSNNYKFCLSMHIQNNDNIFLCCYIIKGKDDDKVPWPMKHEVTLSIINQETRTAHTSATYQVATYMGDRRAFDKPKNDINELYIGSAAFITYSSIKYSGSIIMEGSIVVWCTIKDL